MDTFGERLRSEREDRGLTIQAVARTLGVDGERLRALERNEFRLLPDNDTMRGCLRSYAECLEVDAELMIEDYLHERALCLSDLDRAVTAQRVAQTLPVAQPSALARRPTFPRWLAILGIIAIALLGAWWTLTGHPEPTPSDKLAPAPLEQPSAATVDEPDPAPIEETSAATVDEPPPAPARQPVATADATRPPAAALSRLTVSEHGVGEGVEHRQLVDRGERFHEGTQVWYWTRIEGGRVGDRVEHVWFRDGVEVASMTLKIGGSPWRTYSAKTLRAGSVGEWTVETRDTDGRVLAREGFDCVR